MFGLSYVQWLGLYYLVCFFITMRIFSYYKTTPKKVKGFHADDYENHLPLPFVRTDPEPGVYETLKTSVMVMFLPLRLFATMGLLIFVWSIARLVWIGRSDFDTPLPSFRRNMMRYVYMYGSRCILLTMGIWVKVDRSKQSSAKDCSSAAVTVGNHVSWIDILIGNAFFGTAFVAKAATTKVPFSGYLARAQQCCFVSQASRTGKKDAAKPKMSTTDKIIHRQQNPEQWSKLILFPEGTTTNGRYMTVFRSGAFVSGRPVQPIAIQYHGNNFSLAYESIYGAYHIFRTLTQVISFATLTVMPVYKPSEAEQKDPKLYAANVGKAIGAELNIPNTTWTFNDKLAYLKYIRGDAEKRAKKLA